MDSSQENQFEDGFHQIEDMQWSGQEEKLKGSPADEGTVENPFATIKTCDFCGKTFNNGRSFGGHRRHHLQALRKAAASAAAQSQKVNNRLPKPKNYNTSSSVNDIGENNIIKMEALMSKGGRTISGLCGKDFPSMKLYHGHMRAHLERERSGAASPPEYDSKELKEEDCITSSTVIEPHESPVDLAKYLSSWAKTDLRGRKSIGGVEAAQNLVYLSRDAYLSAPGSLDLGSNPNTLPQAMLTDDAVEPKSSISGIAMQCREKKVDDSPSWEQTVRRKNFQGRGSLNGGKDKEEGANKDEEDREDMKDDYSYLDESEIMVMNEKKRKKILKLNSLQSSESEENPLTKSVKAPNRYKCSICGKSFPCFQALGGHTASHSKGKSIARTIDGLDYHNKIAAGFSILQVNDTKGTEFRLVVKEAADSAQALGDHHSRSSCCSVRSSAETPLSEEASSVGTNPFPPRIFDFDLNEPYVNDEQIN